MLSRVRPPSKEKREAPTGTNRRHLERLIRHGLPTRTLTAGLPKSIKSKRKNSSEASSFVRFVVFCFAPGHLPAHGSRIRHAIGGQGSGKDALIDAIPEPTYSRSELPHRLQFGDSSSFATSTRVQ